MVDAATELEFNPRITEPPPRLPIAKGTGVTDDRHRRTPTKARWMAVAGLVALSSAALTWRWWRRCRSPENSFFAGMIVWMASQTARVTKATRDRLQPPQHIGPLENRWMQVNGQTIFVRASTAPVPIGRLPVILVHGLPMSSLYMVPLATRLASDYHVYAPDLPGFGNSAKPQRTLSIPELADALANWMQVAGLEKAVFVGNSFGCQVIAHFAVRYPQYVTRVVLEDPTMNPHARHLFQQVWHDLVDLTREPVSLLLIIARDLLACGVGRFLRTYVYAINDPVQDKLRQLRVPTLVVRGSGDVIVPQWWAEQVTRVVPHARFVALPNAAHTSNYARPQELVRLIRPFLNGQCGAAAASTTALH